MTILALDCGNKTGWALWDGAMTSSGVRDFTPKPADPPGLRWLRFADWLITMGRTSVIVYERWTTSPGIAAKISAGFITRIEALACQEDRRLLEVSPAELKRWLTGNGHASKAAMIAAVSQKAWKAGALSADEADALALLHYAMEKGKPT